MVRTVSRQPAARKWFCGYLMLPGSLHCWLRTPWVVWHLDIRRVRV